MDESEQFKQLDESTKEKMWNQVLPKIVDNHQINYWKVLDEIRGALVEINQTLKTKL